MKRIILIVILASVILIGCREDEELDSTDGFTITTKDLQGTWDAVECYHYGWNNIRDFPDLRTSFSFYSDGAFQGDGLLSTTYYGEMVTYTLRDNTVTVNLSNDGDMWRFEFVAFDKENGIAEIYVVYDYEDGYDHYSAGILLKIKRR